MKRAVNQTIKEFCQHLSSGAPTPGGGSGAALSGVMGSSLMLMVANVSFGKSAYEKLSEEIKSQIKADYETISNLNKTLTALIEEDINAFNEFMFALKMPQSTEEEKVLRSIRIKAASLGALEVPLKTASACLRLLETQENLARYGIKNVISDIGVGSLLSLASLEAAVLNVHINLPWVDDQVYKQAVIDQCQIMTNKGKILHEQAMAIVHERIGLLVE